MDSMRTPQEQQMYDEILAGINELAQTVTGPLSMFLEPILEMVRPQVESISPHDLRTFLAEARAKIDTWLTPEPALVGEVVFARPAPAMPELAAVPERPAPTAVVVHAGALPAEPEPQAEPAPRVIAVLTDAAPLPETPSEVIVLERTEAPSAKTAAECEAISLQTAPPEGALGVQLDENGFGSWYDPTSGTLTLRQPTLEDAQIVADAINEAVNPMEKAHLMRSGELILRYLAEQIAAG
jgi:hypothetical protein